MPGALILVTGGNRGLGLEVCRQLARARARVLLTARDGASSQRAAAELRAEGLEVVAAQLDVGSRASIDALAQQLEADGVRLQALVNNAGVMLHGSGAEVATETLAVNFFGALDVTDRMLPLCDRGSRIVMVSSGLGELQAVAPHLRKQLDPPASRDQLIGLMRSYLDDMARGRAAESGWPASSYATSKVGLGALTRVLAQELRDRGVKVYAVCPGWVRTRMGGRGAPRTVSEGADTITWAALAPDLPTGTFFRDRTPISW